MARLYTNENFPIPAAGELRRLGHDVVTIQETGKANLSVPDVDALAFTVSDNRIFVTLNRLHFIRLHRKIPKHKGIIVCSLDPDFSALADRIDKALREESLLDGKLLRINRPPINQ